MDEVLEEVCGGETEEQGAGGGVRKGEEKQGENDKEEEGEGRRGKREGWG